LIWTRKDVALLAISIVSAAVLVGTLLYYYSNNPSLQANKLTIRVGYQGLWSLTWVGYQGGPDHPTSGNNYIRFGNKTLNITVYTTTSESTGATICAWAGKLDDSNKTLSLGIFSDPGALAIGGLRETAAPNGIVSVCGRVVP
jgi:hypothetical protein